jgi:hypothetical protein
MKPTIDGTHPALWGDRQFGWHIAVSRLAKGMHASVSAASRLNGNRLLSHRGQRFLNLVLHPQAIGLSLPALPRSAIIRDGES